jgi:23S rRNA pseudouridine1911/1915/1917 synthase
VLLFARTAAAARSLARQRARGILVRDYLALVAGHPPPTGEISLALGPDPAHRTRRLVYPATAAQVPLAPSAARVIVPALTTYRVVQYGPHATLVAAQLQTGRTHQLRAHFAAIGHPLLADDLYGGPPSPIITRQALHAWRTRLQHPTTATPLTLLSPIPPDFHTAASIR